MKAREDILRLQSHTIAEPSQQSTLSLRGAEDGKVSIEPNTAADPASPETVDVANDKAKATSEGNPLSLKLTAISREVHYSLVLMLLVVVVVWGKRRLRSKLRKT